MKSQGGEYIQSEQSEIVLIRKGNPRRVIISEGVHYFYWRMDLYKPFDYEPVKTFDVDERVHVLTRYHWKGTVVWTSPKMKQGKPILDFYLGVHTPLIITENGWFTLTCDLVDLTPIEKKQLFHLYIPLIVDMLEGRIDISVDQTHGYKDKITYSNVPEEYIFSPSQWKFLIVIGQITDFSKLPTELQSQVQRAQG